MKYEIIDRFFGSVFREKRLGQGLTTQDVADRIGLKRQTYYYYEIGERSMPLDVLKSLCLLYGVDWMDLIRQGQQVYLEAVEHGGEN